MERETQFIDTPAEPAEVLLNNLLSDDPVRDYLRNINKTPLLTAEQEVELSKRIEAGQYAAHLLLEGSDSSTASQAELEWLVEDGVNAKKNFVEANTRLVVSVARKYTRHTTNMELLDLIQEGNIGLNRAVEKFDYQKSYKFSTYATWWVRQGITRALAEKERTIRIPVHLHDTILSMNKVVRELETEGLSPTLEMIAEGMGVDVERVKNLRDWSMRAISLDLPVSDDGETTIGSLLDSSEDSMEDTVIFSELREKVRQSLSLLGEREEKIMLMRFGLDDGIQKNLKQIGEAVGVSHERVRQLITESIRKLRRHSELEQYIETRPAS